ncbi:18 kDa heat shock protein [bioreactor metagenome]|uniref:18 kDa heat shock protein n=1 Tax=bioreactor metagenome TaxID=1076179 RepID=A0A645FKL3_9ZZZZ
MFGSCGFRVDVKDEKDHYALEAELPGVPKEQIEVSVDNGVLTIAANMNSEKKTEKDNYVYSERKTGRFQRSFNLEGIREQDIKADYKDGILKLELPKAQPAAQPSRRLIDIGDSAN